MIFLKNIFIKIEKKTVLTNTTGIFHACTREICLNDPILSQLTDDIEEVSKLNQNILKNMIDDIWSWFENLSLTQQHKESKNLDEIRNKIFHVINTSSKSSKIVSCREDRNCSLVMRNIVLQLKLIQLKYLSNIT